MPPSKEMEKTRKVYKGPSALDIGEEEVQGSDHEDGGTRLNKSRRGFWWSYC